MTTLIPDDAKPMAKVRGEGMMNGLTPQDIPPGYISWEEHYMAWEGYSKGRREPVSAKLIEERGGFSYREVARWLGHNPVSWVLREPIRYAEFQFAPEDAPADLSRPKFVEEPVQLSHIRDGASENPICEIEDDAPDGMLFFDAGMGGHCTKCETKIEVLVSNWIALSGPDHD